jgi:hypothetical protein
MTKCGFFHIPGPMDEEPVEPSWSCQKEARFTCCDYGGKVCEEHRCRCSKPLSEKKSWLCWCGKPSRLDDRHSWCGSCDPLEDDQVAELAAYKRDGLSRPAPLPVLQVENLADGEEPDPLV